MEKMMISFAFGIMTMIFNGILFTLYDKLVEGYVNTKYLLLTALLGFFSGVFSYFSLSMTGVFKYLAQKNI